MKKSYHIAYDVYDDDAVLKLKKQLSKLQGLATMNTMEFLPELFKNPKEESLRHTSIKTNSAIATMQTESPLITETTKRTELQAQQQQQQQQQLEHQKAKAIIIEKKENERKKKAMNEAEESAKVDIDMREVSTTMEILPNFKCKSVRLNSEANANIQRSEEDNQNLEHEILTKPDLKCVFNTVTVTTATAATTTLSENIFSCNARFYTTTTVNANTATNTITTANTTNTTTATTTTCSPSTVESFPFSNDFGNNATGGNTTTTTVTATDAIGNFKVRDEFYESSAAVAVAAAATDDTARNNCNGQTLVMPSNLNRSKNNGERRNNEKSIDDVGVVRKFADFSTKSPNTNFEMLNEMPKNIEEDNSGQQRFHMTNEINVNRNAKGEFLQKKEKRDKNKQATTSTTTTTKLSKF
uniref:Uncharacterized protein n=1 Tax=Glossina austeni TaxID=7395 RepID=A0A1A9UQB0_GLOAU